MVKYINIFMFYEMMVKLPLFIRKILWRLRFSKWIYRIEHLETLVKVLQCISPKLVNAQTKIQEFCKEAQIVINAGEHASKQILDKLESLLQEISNDSKLRRFLGRNEPTIGGGNGINEAWSSAKMHDFFHGIMLWETEKSCNIRFSFNEEESLRVLTSNDIQLYGRTAGPLFRSRMHLIWLANGKISASFASLDSARTIALTPRGERHTSIASSSSSIQTPQQTPRPLNVLETPPTVQISCLNRPPMITPRFDEKDSSWLLEKFWSEEFLAYLRDCYNLSRMERTGALWVFYDLLNWYKRQDRYKCAIFFNKVLQETFFQSMLSTKLVFDALTIFLSHPLTDNSLLNLRREPLSKQEDFFEVLRMVIRHELWQIQTQDSSNPSMFIYKSSKGAWVQDPESFDFVLVPHDALPQRLTKIVEVA